MSTEEIGLMAPIGSKARAEYEKRRQRENSVLGLIAALAEPLTFVPHPLISVPATIAENIGKEGLLDGLLKSWDVLLPPIKTAKPFLSVVTTKERALRNAIPLGRQFGKDLVYNPDVHFKLSDELLDAARKDRTWFGYAKDALKPGSEVLRAHPELEKVKISFWPVNKPPGWVEGGYESYDKYIRLLASPTTAERDLAPALAHELNHAANHLTGLSNGSNIVFELARMLSRSPRPDDETVRKANRMLKNNPRLEEWLYNKYKAVAGEAHSRLTERLLNRSTRGLTTDEILKLYDVPWEKQQYRPWSVPWERDF